MLHVQDSPERVLASMLYLNDSKECQNKYAAREVRKWNDSVNEAIADPQMQNLLGCVSMSGISCSRLEDICRTFCCKVLMGMR